MSHSSGLCLWQVIVLKATKRCLDGVSPLLSILAWKSHMSHAMRPSDPAALRVQLQQDAGGDVAVAEAEAGAEQELMLSSMILRKAVIAPSKETVASAQSPCGQCSAQAKHCSILITRHLPQAGAAVSEQRHTGQRYQAAAVDRRGVCSAG